MAEGGKAAIQADNEVVAASRVRELEAKVRDLESLLGRKTMEAEILREALDASRGKSPTGGCHRCLRPVPDKGCGRHPRRR
jgi:transposase